MKRLLICAIGFLLCSGSRSVRSEETIRLGIIGLDTSHSPTFVKIINGENPKPEFKGFKVIAAYPYGSKTIQSSYDRISNYQEEVVKYGVKITESIEELLDQADCVLLETNDGNLHLEQAMKVFKAGKPVFIDKPIGANLAQSIAVVELAKRYQVPVFSSSALRFVSQNQKLRAGEFGKVVGADCFSPATNEPSHADLYWYGIHGVETLFTIMGSGCESVSAVSAEGSDLAVGKWADGRLGSFRGIRQGKHSFGGKVVCEKQVVDAGGYEGYEGLLEAVLQFFRTKTAPVDIEETMEIYTFMEAFNESRRQGGKPVRMDDVYEKAEKAAENLIDQVALPHGRNTLPEPVPHFPDRLHAFVWRNWNLVTVEKMASVIHASAQEVKSLAQSMGLPDYREPSWNSNQLYITLIRRNWHLLPYEQILQLTDMTPGQLNRSLREDDFLWVKLGQEKPRCEPIRWKAPDKEAIERAQAIRQIVESSVPDKEPIARFSFIDDLKATGSKKYKNRNKGKSLRFIYSYFALYGDPLANDAEIFPDGLLEKLSDSGVNGVWLHVLLRDLAPGGDHFPEFGEKHEIRLAKLHETVEKAKKYGVDIYLYLNEPRSMPVAFFENKQVPGRKLTQGVREGDYCALCTSNEDVRQWIVESLSHVFTKVPGLGGVFTISGSENLTFCNSHGQWEKCPRCGKREGAEVIADANALIATGVHKAAPDAKVIVWDWGWNRHGMAPEIIRELPPDVWLMSVSEWGVPIERGGVKTRVGEYSISAIGPGERAKMHWRTAQEKGLKTAAKVQLNCTWEIASVPFVPVMDLVAEHCSNLVSSGVDGYLMSWSLGGYPSPNLEIPQLFDRKPAPSKEEVLDALALKRYGKKGAAYARKAWTLMSEAYKEYPFTGAVVYYSPVQIGPANLLRPQPAGYRATMSGIPYDDLTRWRSIFPAPVFAQQYEKMSEGFLEALPLLEKAVALAGKEAGVEAELRYAKVVCIHFASVANQVRYVMLRDRYLSAETSETEKRVLAGQIRPLIENEIQLAGQLYELTLEDSCVGFESANQYFYVPNDLLEKIVSCRQLLEMLPE